jgi:hypothetical protein
MKDQEGTFITKSFWQMAQKKFGIKILQNKTMFAEHCYFMR